MIKSRSGFVLGRAKSKQKKRVAGAHRSSAEGVGGFQELSSSWSFSSNVDVVLLELGARVVREYLHVLGALSGVGEEFQQHLLVGLPVDSRDPSLW